MRHHYIKQTNIHIMRAPEGEEREKWTERLFEEIMVENPKFDEIHGYKQEAQRTPSKINSETHNEAHYNKAIERQRQRILKAEIEKQLITYKGLSIRLLADILSETLQARRQWVDRSKVLKVKTLSTKNPIYSKTVLQK